MKIRHPKQSIGQHEPRGSSEMQEVEILFKRILCLRPPTIIDSLGTCGKLYKIHFHRERIGIQELFVCYLRFLKDLKLVVIVPGKLCKTNSIPQMSGMHSSNIRRLYQIPMYAISTGSCMNTYKQISSKWISSNCLTLSHISQAQIPVGVFGSVTSDQPIR